MSDTFDRTPDLDRQLARIFDGGDTARPLALLVARYTLDTLAEVRREELPEGFTLKAYPQSVPLLATAWLRAMRELYPADERLADDDALKAFGAERDRWTAAAVDLLEEGLDLAELGEPPDRPAPTYAQAAKDGRAALDYRLTSWLKAKLAARAQPKVKAKAAGFDPTAKILREELDDVESEPADLEAWRLTYTDPATGERHLLDPPAELVTQAGEIVDSGEPEPDEQLDLGLFEMPTAADLEATLRDSDRVTSWAAGEPPPPEASAPLPDELRAKLAKLPARRPELIALDPSLLRASRFATVARCAWAVSVRSQLHGLAAARPYLVDRRITETIGNLHHATFEPDTPSRAAGGDLRHKVSGATFARLEAAGGDPAADFRAAYSEAWQRLVKSVSDRHPAVVPLLDPMLQIFGQRSIDLWNSLTPAQRRTFHAGRVFPALRFKGFKGLGDALQVRQHEVPIALELLRTLTLPRLPDGSLFPQLLHYTDNRATGELLVYLHPPLLPHAAKSLNLTDKRLVPHPKLPRFERLPNQYRGAGAVAGRSLIATMRDRSDELLEHKAIRLTRGDLFDILNSALGPSATKGAAPPAEKWLDAWLEIMLSGDSYAGPVLERVGPDLYHLHPDHAEQRRLLFDGAKRSREGAEAGRRSGAARKAKRDAHEPPTD